MLSVYKTSEQLYFMFSLLSSGDLSIYFFTKMIGLSSLQDMLTSICCKHLTLENIEKECLNLAGQFEEAS